MGGIFYLGGGPETLYTDSGSLVAGSPPVSSPSVKNNHNDDDVDSDDCKPSASPSFSPGVVFEQNSQPPSQGFGKQGVAAGQSAMAWFAATQSLEWGPEILGNPSARAGSQPYPSRQQSLPLQAQGLARPSRLSTVYPHTTRAGNPAVSEAGFAHTTRAVNPSMTWSGTRRPEPPRFHAGTAQLHAGTAGPAQLHAGTAGLAQLHAGTAGAAQLHAGTAQGLGLISGGAPQPNLADLYKMQFQSNLRTVSIQVNQMLGVAAMMEIPIATEFMLTRALFVNLRKSSSLKSASVEQILEYLDDFVIPYLCASNRKAPLLHAVEGIRRFLSLAHVEHILYLEDFEELRSGIIDVFSTFIKAQLLKNNDDTLVKNGDDDDFDDDDMDNDDDAMDEDDDVDNDDDDMDNDDDDVDNEDDDMDNDNYNRAPVVVSGQNSQPPSQVLGQQGFAAGHSTMAPFAAPQPLEEAPNGFLVLGNRWARAGWQPYASRQQSLPLQAQGPSWQQSLPLQAKGLARPSRLSSVYPYTTRAGNPAVSAAGSTHVTRAENPSTNRSGAQRPEPPRFHAGTAQGPGVVTGGASQPDSTDLDKIAFLIRLTAVFEVVLHNLDDAGVQQTLVPSGIAHMLIRAVWVELRKRSSLSNRVLVDHELDMLDKVLLEHLHLLILEATARSTVLFMQAYFKQPRPADILKLEDSVQFRSVVLDVTSAFIRAHAQSPGPRPGTAHAQYAGQSSTAGDQVGRIRSDAPPTSPLVRGYTVPPTPTASPVLAYMPHPTPCRHALPGGARHVRHAGHSMEGVSPHQSGMAPTGLTRSSGPALSGHFGTAAGLQQFPPGQQSQGQSGVTGPNIYEPSSGPALSRHFGTAAGLQQFPPGQQSQGQAGVTGPNMYGTCAAGVQPPLDIPPEQSFDLERYEQTVDELLNYGRQSGAVPTGLTRPSGPPLSRQVGTAAGLQQCPSGQQSQGQAGGTEPNMYGTCATGVQPPPDVPPEQSFDLEKFKQTVDEVLNYKCGL
jgi:hypothetical protein